jgi:hypothetical protein
MAIHTAGDELGLGSDRKFFGPVAQLGEHPLDTGKVGGSIPSWTTIMRGIGVWRCHRSSKPTPLGCGVRFSYPAPYTISRLHLAPDK